MAIGATLATLVGVSTPSPAATFREVVALAIHHNASIKHDDMLPFYKTVSSNPSIDDDEQRALTVLDCLLDLHIEKQVLQRLELEVLDLKQIEETLTADENSTSLIKKAIVERHQSQKQQKQNLLNVSARYAYLTGSVPTSIQYTFLQSPKPQYLGLLGQNSIETTMNYDPLDAQVQLEQRYQELVAARNSANFSVRLYLMHLLAFREAEHHQLQAEKKLVIRNFERLAISNDLLLQLGLSRRLITRAPTENPFSLFIQPSQ